MAKKNKKDPVIDLLKKYKKTEDESVKYPEQIKLERKSWLLWKILNWLLGKGWN